MTKNQQLLQHASQFLNKGIAEIAGSRSHPQIKEWIEEIEKLYPTDLTIDDSLYAWCGVFVGCMCLDLHFPLPAYPQAAKHWESWGVPVKLDARLPGDVLVLHRPGGYHVAILNRVINSTEDEILGGNQSNAVTLARWYSRAIVAVRRLI